jgi:hypothetical protein
LGTCDVGEEFFQGEVIIVYRSLWPDLNLTASAVQPYMFEPTKETEGEKSASGSEENSDSDDDLEISHGSDANEFDEDEETEHVSHW